MRFKDQFQFVRKNMKKNRTRIFMTILATAMGCAFLIVLASVGFGLHKSVIKQITEQRVVTSIDVHGKQDENNAYHEITDEDIAYFEGLENVKAVTRRKMMFQEGMYKVEGYQVDAQTLVAHMPSEVKAGFELSAGRLPEKPTEIIVGYDFLQALIPEGATYEDAYDEQGVVKEDYQFKGELVGKEVILTVRKYEDEKEVTKDIPLTIVGVGKEPTRSWSYDRNAFISQEIFKEIETFTGTSNGMPAVGREESGEVREEGPPTYHEVKIYATDLSTVEGLSDKLEGEKYGVYSVVNELKEVNILFTIMKVGLIFIGTVAIVIASIGIYNTMTMAVTERAPDIGIMKAIGASPSVIKKIFLIESSYIGLLGAFFGTVVAYLISVGVNFGLPLIISSAFGEKPPEDLMFTYIPWNLPLICVAICLGVTILSGMRPAQRATKVDVLKAMRREV
ncbi:ABC transporter permease [Bacillus timonensis]|nr:ABC transporter permease [Bacillus timonensis]